ncbi:hypothetical protein [Nodularia chucula]|uniref:hypothetical protein n=1 Tax=Nodularia chucula TaxID=3093667 RepID=UPI0039C7422D
MAKIQQICDQSLGVGKILMTCNTHHFTGNFTAIASFFYHQTNLPATFSLAILLFF